MVEFKNADVAKKYKTTRTTDPKIHMPGKGGSGWAGRLSEITLTAADKLFQDKRQNLIELKDQVAPAQVINTVDEET